MMKMELAPLEPLLDQESFCQTSSILQTLWSLWLLTPTMIDRLDPSSRVSASPLVSGLVDGPFFGHFAVMHFDELKMNPSTLITSFWIENYFSSATNKGSKDEGVVVSTCTSLISSIRWLLSVGKMTLILFWSRKTCIWPSKTTVKMADTFVYLGAHFLNKI